MQKTLLKYLLKNRRHLALTAVLFAACLAASAQCSMCRDTTAGSGPSVRASLRRAIPVLGIPAVLIFSGIFWIAFRRDRTNKHPL